MRKFVSISAIIILMDVFIPERQDLGICLAQRFKTIETESLAIDGSSLSIVTVGGDSSLVVARHLACHGHDDR